MCVCVRLRARSSVSMSFVANAIVILGRIFLHPYTTLANGVWKRDYLAEMNVRPELTVKYMRRVFTCKIHFENYIL